MIRKFKRVVHRHFGGVGNLCAIFALVIVTAIFLNISVLSKRHPSINGITATSHTDEGSNDRNQTIQPIFQPVNVKLKRPLLPDAGCEIEEKCSDDTIPYKAVSGDGLSKYPIICFNDKLLVEKSLKNSKVGRGLNVAVIDGNTFEVKIIDTFDTYVEDSFLLRTLRWSLKEGDIIMMASYDEISYGLKESSRSLLEKYGSQMIRAIKFRDSYVMIGQKGLAHRKAIEMHQPKGNREFAPAAHISGCVKFPLGQISTVPVPTADIKQEGKIAVGASIKNCGLTAKCNENEFAVHVYTGKDNNDEPKICVDGKYVIARGINDAGRGINVVVVANGKDVIRTGHFDTWQDDSANLEIFLENLEDNMIIIAVTFDEASLKLSQHSRNLFFDLGSATIQNLKYRDVWMLVGQKGIKGFTPYEEISYSNVGNSYATPINKMMCVPNIIQGNKIRPDPIPIRNDQRREFCSRHDGYGDFCNNINVDKSLEPVPLINKTLEDSPIYSTPILIIAGISHNSLRMCLETILMQPGINVDSVLVAVDEKFAEPIALIELFKFRNKQISSSTTYIEHYEKALKAAWEIYPEKNEMIVIEEDLILSPDFLYTLALLSDTFRKDETLSVIQMWNPNSYDSMNGSVELVYRVNQFFGLGYLMKRSFYETHIKPSFQTCCSKRVWEQWKIPKGFSSLMPDVSRIFRRPIHGNQLNAQYIDALFNRKRKTSLSPFPALSNIETLRKEKYDLNMQRSIEKASLLKPVEKCERINDDILTTIINQNVSTALKMIYRQTSDDDITHLTPILSCFGLFPREPLGLYQALLRFHQNQHDVYLIGSKSPLLK